MSIAETTKHQEVISYRDSGLVSLLFGAFQRVTHWHNQRKAVRQLSNFPDTMLKDIGLTRGEIPDAIRHGRSEILKLHRR